MKILMVSIPSLHFTRWTSQLESSGHEVHWFDILNGGYNKNLPWVTQHTQWRYKGGDFKGRTWLKKKLPWVHQALENNVEKAFEKVLKEVQPDVVHTFVMYACCVPIFPVMLRYPKLKWVYSSWGSDLFYYKELPNHRKDLETVLPHIDYMFSDTLRDQKIAAALGFKGTALGVFPGGGGFHWNQYQAYVKPPTERETILIKGYEGRSGRAIAVLKSVLQLEVGLRERFNWKVFGADDEVVAFIQKHKALTDLMEIISTKKRMMPHKALLEEMGKSLVYIGNSQSDGMPNTLLEAIGMGAFPIQSNPGGATAEVITPGMNGFLIEDEEAVPAIAKTIAQALTSETLWGTAFQYNQQKKEQWAFAHIQKEVLTCYHKIATETLL
ncbi:MAG: glycosyl transferase family 1 [Alteromonas sp.]|nr:glycosyl transferase family 1 [Alteromonas sp.]MAY23651.1 glycosyl transferase family 1 [Flavobacteriaceae bacterium]|tara:strand:- start:41939 stop:43087 length:1149 start_codon:yes stop_codon:yes gene_type:complete